MITTMFTSRKCGTAYVAVMLLLVCVRWISGETISISYGTDNDNPEEGDLNYQFDCMIFNLESPVIAWSKDDNLLFWSGASNIEELDTTEEYMIQGRLSNPTTNFILTITQVRNHHSGNYTCFTATGNTQDFNVVQSSVVYITVIPGTFTPSVTNVPRQTFNRAASTTSPFDSTPVTSTSQSTASQGLPIYVIAAIGGGGGLLLIALISCIITICCCRCRNHESDIKFEDGGTTRISTGYMWDKELSHMVHDSPRPSPKLTNNNHAHVRQALKDPDESAPGMSPSLAYALANHSDVHLDSEDGDFKKPVSAAFETEDLNPAGRVLEHGVSVHSNLYASSAIATPPPPMSSSLSADFPPTYAVPDKNKYPSSRADDDATPTKSPYEIVHLDPENPIVRASLRERATEEHINAAYDPNEEGFVENGIYEPAAR